jgi:hypothetical protein
MSGGAFPSRLGAPATKTAIGVIAVVQEHRFRLAADDGRWQLFVLAHDAPLEGPELQALQRARVRVAVRYVDAPDLIAGIARDVVPIGPPYRTERSRPR